MDLNTIFQLRNKKIWWVDVVYYLTVSLLIATIICYAVFLIKNWMQRSDLSQIKIDLLSVGTSDDKDREAKVILYRQKINDFGNLIESHEFASNVFAFMEDQTQPNVWFSQFNLDQKNNQVVLTGVADDMDTFSRQIASFEKSEYVKNVGTLNSALNSDAKIDINVTLALYPKIFSYVNNLKNRKNQETVIVSNSLSETGTIVENTETTGQTTAEGQAVNIEKSSEKMIFSFTLPSIAESIKEIVGTIDQTNHKITLDVPYGTNISDLTPKIIISEKASVYPEPGVPQNFSEPVIYEVKAEDGSAQNYTVSVNMLPKEEVLATTESSNIGVIIFLLVAGISLIIIAILVGYLVLNNKKSKIRKI